MLDQTTAIARDIESMLDEEHAPASSVQTFIQLMGLLAIYSGGLAVVLKESSNFGVQQELAERTFFTILKIVATRNPESTHLECLRKYEERLKAI